MIPNAKRCVYCRNGVIHATHLIDHAYRDSLDNSDPELEQIDLERAFVEATGLTLPEEDVLRRELVNEWRRALRECGDVITSRGIPHSMHRCTLPAGHTSAHKGDDASWTDSGHYG